MEQCVVKIKKIKSTAYVYKWRINTSLRLQGICIQLDNQS